MISPQFWLEVLAINRAIASAEDYEEVLRQVVDRTAAFTGAAACLLLLSQGDGLARVVRSVGIDPAKAAQLAVPLTERIQAELYRLLGLPASHRFAGVPVIGNEGLMGILAVCWEDPHAERATDVDLISAFADQAAIALDNIKRVRRLQASAEALQASEARLAGIISTAADAIISVDEAQRILLYNEGAHTIFGWSKEEVLGKPLELLIPERFAGSHAQHVGSFAAGPKTARKMGAQSRTLIGLRKSGEEFPVDVAISKLNVGGAWQFTAVLRDITERSRAEQALRSSEANLAEANRKKDQFLAVLSHELRTPLAAIAGWASVMKKSASLEEVQRAAGAIERNALVQSRMVDDLLDLSGIAQGNLKLDLEVLDLSVCVRAALETTSQDMQSKAIHVDFVDAGEPLFVEGDSGRLQQVFRNILSNAAKFTPAGGSVRVSLGRDGGHAAIAFADTGKGIAPEFLPFVFDIFRQQEQGTSRVHEGLGIGLSLVKKLTERHQGTVSVASAGAGLGTEVTVRLPLAAKISALDEAAKPSAEALAGLSVLVVEDMQEAREALQALLRLLGARVSVACDGREALDMILRGASPDVVLCDLLMPRMDGFDFIRELDCAPSRAHPPVIAVSGLATEASRRRTLDAGFEGHLKKPYNEGELVAAVSAVLSHRRELHP
jgi:two-component system CheB/CheR fusion protein